jgi:hypothetical protein
MSTDTWHKFIAALITLAIIATCYACAYNAEEEACRKRGGHLEHIIGGRGYSCEGTVR